MLNYKIQSDLSWILDTYLHTIGGQECILPTDRSLRESYYVSKNVHQLSPIACGHYDISPWIKADRDPNLILRDETFIIKIENGKFLDDTSIILDDANGCLLRHQSLDSVYGSSQWENQQKDLQIRATTHLNGNVLLLNSSWGSEYSHFIYSILGRYLKYLSFPVFLDEINYIVLPEKKSFIDEWIDAINIPREKIIHTPSSGNSGHPGNLFSCNNLLIPSSSIPGDAKSIALMRNTFLKNVAPSPPHRLLFLSREKNKDLRGRYIVNTHDLYNDLLKNLGFELIIEENLSLSQKAELFNQAKFVISAHGSGPIVHCAFMQKMTTIVEVFPEHWMDFCLPNIAKFVGVNYYYHVADTIENGNLYLKPENLKTIIQSLLI